MRVAVMGVDTVCRWSGRGHGVARATAEVECGEGALALNLVCRTYGLPSADRNTKFTLPLTGPHRTSKSSGEDLTPPVPKLQYANYRRPLRGRRRDRPLRRKAQA